MAISRNQVRALTNLNAKQSLQKYDGNDLIFEASGSLATGHVSSSVPLTASNLISANAISGSGKLSAGSGYIAGSFEVGGDFVVRGQPTILNTEVLEIKDNIIVVNKVSGSNSAYNSAEGGIYVNRGSDLSSSLLWVSSSNDWNFYSAGTDLADVSARKIKTTLLSGSTEVSVNSNFIMAGTASLHTSGSFTNFTVNATSKTVEGVSYNIINLESALHAIDDALAVAGNTTNTANAYKRLRYQYSGTLDANGYAEVQLPLTQNGGNAFQVADLDYVTTDVMVDLAGRWVNDLVAIDLQVSASALWVSIDAPASANTGFRLIAVNENTSSYSI